MFKFSLDSNEIRWKANEDFSSLSSEILHMFTYHITYGSVVSKKICDGIQKFSGPDFLTYALDIL